MYFSYGSIHSRVVSRETLQSPKYLICGLLQKKVYHLLSLQDNSFGLKEFPLLLI
jgi:hypothetical protein